MKLIFISANTDEGPSPVIRKVKHAFAMNEDSFCFNPYLFLKEVFDYSDKIEKLVAEEYAAKLAGKCDALHVYERHGHATEQMLREISAAREAGIPISWEV